MSPYVGASVLYRDEHGNDYAAVVTRLKADGSVDLTFFAPYSEALWATCKGWSHVGSYPDTPLSNTWRWRTIHEELGPSGRSFIAEMMGTPARWHAVLVAYANLEMFHETYRAQREQAIRSVWPELPAPKPDPFRPPLEGPAVEFKTSSKNGTGNEGGGVLQ